MKASDIVNKLAVNLPKNSSNFTSNISVTSLTRSGFTATVDTSTVHGLTVGQQVNMNGAESPISVSTLTRSGAIGTLVTATNHDLTINQFVTTESVDLSGSVEAEFNGTFTILTIINRKTITFTMVDSGPTTATGTPLLLNGSSTLYEGWNGLFNVVSTPTTSQFTYTLTTTPPLTTATGTISAKTNPRISSGVSVEACLSAYTKQLVTECWAFVVLGETVASKSRKIDSDAVDNQQSGNEFRQQLVQNFDIAVIIPAAGEIAARTARDLSEDIFVAITKSVVMSKFDSGLYVGAQNPVSFVDHGFALYNGAQYIHSYSFQQVSDLTYDDTVGAEDSAAFRDIDVDIKLNPGTQEDSMTADLNLDETAL